MKTIFKNKTAKYECITAVTFHGGDDELIEDVTFHTKEKDPKIIAGEAKKPDVPKLQGSARPANIKTVPKSGK